MGVNGCDYFAYTIYACIGTEPTPAPPVPTFAPTAPTAMPTTASPTAAPSTTSPTAAPTTASPTSAQPTPVPTTAPPSNTTNSLLAAYWDNGDCGPHGNNHNWEWCDRWNFKCQKSVSTDICDSGRAVLVNTQTFISDGNCTYAYYAQYECEVPDDRLVAYWDYGSCGPHGDNHNWDLCGTWRFRCPQVRSVPAELCVSGTAVLVESKYFQKIGNCPYAYYAQYA